MIMPGGEVAFAILGAVVLSTRRVVPLYAEPNSLEAIDGSLEFNGATVALVLNTTCALEWLHMREQGGRAPNHTPREPKKPGPARQLGHVATPSLRCNSSETSSSIASETTIHFHSHAQTIGTGHVASRQLENCWSETWSHWPALYVFQRSRGSILFPLC